MDKYCFYCMERLPENGLCGCGQSGRKEPPVPGATPAGTVLNGKYLVGHPLGAGGFGMTYIGRDLTLDMKVAIKEYTEGAPGGKERFLREARAMARFSGQSGIVNVRDFFEANGTAFIVMEYLEGITLKEYIGRFGPMAWDTAMSCMLPVLKVLGRIHKEGYIHRDVSPDNIMMLKDGSVKLLDFGAAADVSQEQLRTMTVMLKPGYAPPEQYQGKGGVGPWTDVYAACATIYKCITGETPQDSLSRMFEDQLKPPSAYGADIPQRAEGVLYQGLAVHMEERIRSMEALIEGLTASPKGRTASEGARRAGGRRERPSAGSKNRKVLWLALGGAGVLLAALCLVLIFSGGIGANPYRETDSSYSYLKELTVTDKMIDMINHDEQTENLQLKDCVITDAQLEQLAENTRITQIDMDNCSGFTSLNALAAMPQLKALKLYMPSGSSVDGAALFSVPFPGLTQLVLGHEVNLSSGTDFLGNFPGLTWLTLSGASGVENLGFLAAMPGLQTLQISDVALGDKDYSALAVCTSLETLEAANTGISDLTVLAAAVNMTDLNLGGCGISDLTPLAGMTGLRALHLEDNAISDLSPLSGMTGMTNL